MPRLDYLGGLVLVCLLTKARAKPLYELFFVENDIMALDIFISWVLAGDRDLAGSIHLPPPVAPPASQGSHQQQHRTLPG